jgi:hypothetical protein
MSNEMMAKAFMLERKLDQFNEDIDATKQENMVSINISPL